MGGFDLNTYGGISDAFGFGGGGGGGDGAEGGVN